MKYTIILFFILCSNVLADEWFLQCPKSITNAGKCAAHHVKKLLEKYSSKVTRNADQLVIRSANGKTIQLKNGEWSYYAVKLYEKADLLLVRIQYYEGNSYLIIDMNYGYQKEIEGFPTFNDDYDKFVATDIDLEAQYNPNILSLYVRQNKVWCLEYFIQPKT